MKSTFGNEGSGATRWLRFGTWVLAIALCACDDGLGPAVWDATPDTVTLYSVSRLDLLGRPSAFDVVQIRPVVIESPSEAGAWDFVLAETAGAFVMLPASAVAGLNSRAGIATTTETTLEAVRTAPDDTARFSAAAVPIEVGRIYVVRSRRDICAGFGSGVRYAKLHALALDEARGTFRFAIVRNPLCNDRALVPPEGD